MIKKKLFNPKFCWWSLPSFLVKTSRFDGLIRKSPSPARLTRLFWLSPQERWISSGSHRLPTPFHPVPPGRTPLGKTLHGKSEVATRTGWLSPTPLKNDGVKVSWDDDIPNWMESHKNNVPNHQADVASTLQKIYREDHPMDRNWWITIFSSPIDRLYHWMGTDDPPSSNTPFVTSWPPPGSTICTIFLVQFPFSLVKSDQISIFAGEIMLKVKISISTGKNHHDFCLNHYVCWWNLYFCHVFSAVPTLSVVWPYQPQPRPSSRVFWVSHSEHGVDLRVEKFGVFEWKWKFPKMGYPNSWMVYDGKFNFL